jgi:hypothetical protein
MSEQISVVSVDSRGKSTSDVQCYKEHSCALDLFEKKISLHPSAVCYESKVAQLCGLNINIYFHKDDNADVLKKKNDHLPQQKIINQAASLLTLDPSTGFAKHLITGVAYIVMNDGFEALSWNQVWGLVELIRDAHDYYQQNEYNVEHGKHEMLTRAKLYRSKSWGPISIYKNREERDILDQILSNLTTVTSVSSSRDKYGSHRSNKFMDAADSISSSSKKPRGKPFTTIQV